MNKNIVLLTACLAWIIVMLDVSVVNVALEQLHQTFQGTISGLEWVINGYTLTFAAFLLTAGTLIDRFGSKRVFVFGFFIFALASFFCGIANDLLTLVISRLLQGIGAALLAPAALTIINQTFLDAVQRAKAISLWAASGGIALALGPVFGGLLISSIGWRAVFFVNIPIALVGIWFAVHYIRYISHTKKRVIDIFGQLLAVLTLGGFTIAIIEASSSGWMSKEVVIGLVVGMISLILFISVEKRHSDPMLPLNLFHNSHFTSSSIIGVLINFSFFGLIFLFSLFFQSTWNYTPLQTGFAFLPMTGALMIANLISGKLMINYSFRAIVIAGSLIAALGYLGIFPFVSTSHYFAICVQLLIAGFGIGLAVPAMTNAMISSAESQYLGISSGVLNASRQVGGLLGVSVMGLIVGDVSSEHFLSGLSIALVWVFVAMLISTLVAMYGLKTTTPLTLNDATSQMSDDIG